MSSPEYGKTENANNDHDKQWSLFPYSCRYPKQAICSLVAYIGRAASPTFLASTIASYERLRCVYRTMGVAISRQGTRANSL